MGSMEVLSDDKIFKKFLVQKSILDTFRVYLDMSAEFIDQLESEKVVTADQAMILRGLNWPGNRNEFLQLLVRKKWDKESFETFCEVLKLTQPQKLTDQVVGKAETYIEEMHARDTTRLIDNPFYSSQLVGPLASLPLPAKTAVLGLLKEKEDAMKIERGENDVLRQRLRGLLADNDTVSRQMHLLDKEVVETLSVLGVETDRGHESLEGGMAELRTRMLTDRARITQLRNDVTARNEQIEKLKSTITMLTTEGIKHKESKKHLEEKYEKLYNKTKAEISTLKQELSSARETLHNQRNIINVLKADEKTTKERYEEEIKHLKEKMAHLSKQLEGAVKERDRKMAELVDVNDKTRKLLKVVHLDNNADHNMALSIEHARNIALVKKRKGATTWNGQTDVQRSVDRGSVAKTQNGKDVDSHQQSSASVSSMDSGIQSSDKKKETCQTCGKVFVEDSNFDGACMFHQEGATLLHKGTEVAVWSCCKSSDTAKGCLKGRHVPVQL